MKKNTKTQKFLDELKKVPIITVACEMTDLSRNTIYSWRKKDGQFKEQMDLAMAEGEQFINDLTENQLLALIQDKNWSAISFWLRNRHPKYKEKIEVTHIEKREELNSEEREAVLKALKLTPLLNNELSQLDDDEIAN